MRAILHSIVKKTAAKLGLTLVRAQERPSPIQENVFHSNFSKRALLSYIKSVFEHADHKEQRKHTNLQTTFLIAEILHELGYSVDVVDCMGDHQPEISTYELVIGLGKPIDTVLKRRQAGEGPKVVWFGTGCNPLFSNVVTLQRLQDFYSRTGLLPLASSRFITEDWPLQHEFADWIILHGADFARKTYRPDRISSIHAPVFIHHRIEKELPEWELAKKHVLWFGVGGLIHKGLDLAIEAFRKMPDIQLHICGNMEGESEFNNYYQPIIAANSNIHYHGFVDVKGTEFKEVLKTCAFVLFPSASEGNSPSVLTCMANGGLIPIVSHNADILLNGYGRYVESLTVEEVKAAVEACQTLSAEELKRQSNLILEETRALNTFDRFKIDFKQQLQEALK